MNYTARGVSARGPLQASGAQLLASQPEFKIASTKSTCGTLIVFRTMKNFIEQVHLRNTPVFPQGLCAHRNLKGGSINCGLALRYAGSLSIFGCILVFSDFAPNPSREKKISRHLW